MRFLRSWRYRTGLERLKDIGTAVKDLEPSFNATRLRSPSLHYSYHDLDEVLQRIDRYSSAGAENLRSRKRDSLRKAIRHGLWTFLKNYVLRLGFLVGRKGSMLAVSNAEGVCYRYLKLYYLQRPQAQEVDAPSA